MFDNPRFAQQPQPEKRSQAEAETVFKDRAWRRHYFRVDVRPAPGDHRTGVEISQVVAHKILVGEAIHVYDDEFFKTAHMNRAVQDSRLAEAALFVSDVLYSVNETWCPGIQKG